MEDARREELSAGAAAALRSSGASFAFTFGSVVDRRDGPTADLDVAAWWVDEPPGSWEVAVPDGVDLLVLNEAPLELQGRVALHGQLLFDDDPPARVRWQAQTRLIYFDEEDRQRRIDRDFLTSRG